MSIVWIDTLGQISCLGAGIEALRDKQHHGIDFWNSFYPHATISADNDFLSIEGWNESSETRQMDSLARYSVACASLAMQHSTLDLGNIAKERAGIILGSAFGCTSSNHAFLETFLTGGPRRTSPIVFRNTVSNAAAGHLAIAFKFLGSNSVLNSGMVSGPQAIAFAFEEIKKPAIVMWCSV